MPTLTTTPHTPMVATVATASFGSSLISSHQVKWSKQAWMFPDVDALLVEKLERLKGEETVSFASTKEAIAYLRSLAHRRQ